MLLSLPSELLEDILAEVWLEGTSEFLNVCQACKKLASVGLPFIYRSVIYFVIAAPIALIVRVVCEIRC